MEATPIQNMLNHEKEVIEKQMKMLEAKKEHIDDLLGRMEYDESLRDKMNNQLTTFEIEMMTNGGNPMEALKTLMDKEKGENQDPDHNDDKCW